MRSPLLGQNTTIEVFPSLVREEALNPVKRTAVSERTLEE